MNAAPASLPTVCIVDDDPGLRAALDGLLRSSGLSTTLHGSLDEFRAASCINAPSCLLLDVHLPGQTGLDFLIGMAAERIDIPVVLITGFGDIPLAVRAMKAGAIDVLSKPFTDTQLLRAVGAGINADRARRERRNTLDAVAFHYASLTRREREVMALVTAGLMNKQVAWQLGLSEVTVKIHRRSVMRKMQAKSLPDLVRLCTVVDSLGCGREASAVPSRPN